MDEVGRSSEGGPSRCPVDISQVAFLLEIIEERGVWGVGSRHVPVRQSFRMPERSEYFYLCRHAGRVRPGETPAEGGRDVPDVHHPRSLWDDLSVETVLRKGEVVVRSEAVSTLGGVVRRRKHAATLSQCRQRRRCRVDSRASLLEASPRLSVSYKPADWPKRGRSVCPVSGGPASEMRCAAPCRVQAGHVWLL